MGGLVFAGQQLSQTASSLRANNSYEIYKDWAELYAKATSNRNFYGYFIQDSKFIVDPKATKDAKRMAAQIMNFNYAIFQVVRGGWAPERSWKDQMVTVCDLMSGVNFVNYFSKTLKNTFPDEYVSEIRAVCNVNFSE